MKTAHRAHRCVLSRKHRVVCSAPWRTGEAQNNGVGSKMVAASQKRSAEYHHMKKAAARENGESVASGHGVSTGRKSIIGAHRVGNVAQTNAYRCNIIMAKMMKSIAQSRLRAGMFQRNGSRNADRIWRGISRRRGIGQQRPRFFASKKGSVACGAHRVSLRGAGDMGALRERSGNGRDAVNSLPSHSRTLPALRASRRYHFAACALPLYLYRHTRICA